MNSPYIFISYSRKDEKIAASLHHKLEKYVYPRQWVDEEHLPPHPRCIRPVFLDTADLSAKAHNFTEELRETMRRSRYLLVICTRNAALSDYVREGTAYFLETHDNNKDLILPVFVEDAEVEGLPESINAIKARRNCPVYSVGEDASGRLMRLYCFYRIIEYVLKVDFEKLYNRHEAYRRQKRRVRMGITSAVAAVLCASLGYGWHNAHKHALTAETLATFERQTFPYSLVVGYVDNFLKPMMDAFLERQKQEGEAANHVIIAMPYTYEELQHGTRKQNSQDTFEESRNDYEGMSGETVNVVALQRKNIGITKLRFRSIPVNLYFDEANTVTAFKHVIDYKFSKQNPLHPVKTQESQDAMVREYTNEFIRNTMERLPEEQRPYVHFVRTKEEIRALLSQLRP